MIARGTIIALLALYCAGCGQQLGRNHMTTWRLADASADPAAGLPLESGQIVVTGSNAKLDLFIALMPDTYQRYVHSGVIVVEEDGPYVYEELGSANLGFGDGPPTASVRGEVRRIKLEKFLQRYFYVDIYDPVDLDHSSIVEFAQTHYDAKTPFDAYFDYEDHSKFYCTEFVALALEAGGAGSLPLTKNRDNRSARVVLEWLGIPDEIMLASTLAEQGQPVATLSKTRTLTEIRVLEALKGELHRRYTCDQKLGNLFYWGGIQLELREPAKEFMSEGFELFPLDGPVPEPAQATAAVRELANELLGPFDEHLENARCECTTTECRAVESNQLAAYRAVSGTD
jgi:hypothetical protein